MYIEILRFGVKIIDYRKDEDGHIWVFCNEGSWFVLGLI